MQSSTQQLYLVRVVFTSVGAGPLVPEDDASPADAELGAQASPAGASRLEQSEASSTPSPLAPPFCAAFRRGTLRRAGDAIVREAVVLNVVCTLRSWVAAPPHAKKKQMPKPGLILRCSAAK